MDRSAVVWQPVREILHYYSFGLATYILGSFRSSLRKGDRLFYI